jgi:acetyltransferase-like isoleucine patch superfamily enzyme
MLAPRYLYDYSREKADRRRGTMGAQMRKLPVKASARRLSFSSFNRSRVTIALQYARGRVRGFRNVRVLPGAKFVTNHGEIALACDVRISERTILTATGDGRGPALISVGARTIIRQDCKIDATTAVTIGADCQISWGVQILDTDYHTVDYTPSKTSTKSAPVAIGDRVWVGTGVIILKGVTVGDFAVIGAGSVVTRDVPAHTLVAGNPARAIRVVDGWH